MTAKSCGIMVRIAHSRNTSSSHPFIEKICRPLFNISYNVALACGDDAGKWLFQNKKYITFHNGKDLDKYKFNMENRIEYRKLLNLENKIAIGHVGVFSKQKNHDFLIDVFKNIHDTNKSTCLFLFGIGNLQKEIKEKVHNLGLDDSVYFMNNKNNIEDYLNAMDIMLFPSLFEGLPNVVLEWQANGLPMIMSDAITEECKVCDLVNILPINVGTDNWYNCFNSIVNSTEISNRMKNSENACKMLAENGFEINENTKRIEELYNRLTGKNYIDNTTELNTRKKILFITNKLIGGGSERVLTIIANNFSFKNDVTILSMQKGETYFIENNIKVKYLNNITNKIKKIYEIIKKSWKKRNNML